MHTYLYLRIHIIDTVSFTCIIARCQHSFFLLNSPIYSAFGSGKSNCNIEMGVGRHVNAKGSISVGHFMCFEFVLNRSFVYGPQLGYVAILKHTTFPFWL